MKKNKNGLLKICFVISILIIIGSLFMHISSSGEGYRVVRIAEVNGNVTVVKDGIEYKAYKGMNVSEGAVLVTSAGSNVRMVLDDDKYVKLESGSRMVFETLGLLGSGNTSMKLERGSVTSEIIKPLAVDENFIVNTPNAVLAVRGTYFRVDLSRDENGDTTTDVLTYGGTVASNRVLPDGKVVEEEVLIEVGYKAKINMDTKDTVYVVDEVGGDGKGKKTAKISIDDISDEDLVDIYFASENGHDMFIKSEEIKKNIEIRDIKIEEYTSVYDKVEELEKENEVVVADDSMPLIQEEEKEEEVSSVFGAPYDGAHTHKESRTTVDATCLEDGLTTVTCDTCGMVVQEVVIPAAGHTNGEAVVTLEETCTTDGTLTTSCIICGIIIKEEVISMTGHTAGEPEVTIPATCTTDGVLTTKCTVCEAITKEEVVPMTGHREVTNTVVATCTSKGKSTVKCNVCGLIFSETELEATGHTEVNGGTRNCHSKCSTCGVTIIKEHNISSKKTKAPTCTDKGVMTHTCKCGYSYTTDISETGHTEVTGGTKDCHSKCSVCGTILQNETSHSYVGKVTKAVTCTENGIRTYTCSCGHIYTKEIVATGHAKADENASVTTCSGCGEAWIDLNSKNFKDNILCAYLTTNYDTDTNGVLFGKEITAVTTIDVSGTTTTDGGVTTLAGIEYLPELTSVSCNYNTGITKVDLSQNNKINTFSAINCTGITALDASGCSVLKTINLKNSTAITSLDVSNCASLTTLDTSTLATLQTITVSGSGLISLDVAANTALTTLEAQNCLSLTSVTSEVLEKNSNALSSVDVSGCANLVTLNLKYCSYVTELDLRTLTNLEVLNVAYSGVTIYTGMTGMAFPNNTKLREVYANHINLSAIDLSANADLEVFYNTSNTTTTSLDLTNNVKLRELALGDLTQVTTLDLSKCTLLEFASIGGTKITTLSLTNHPNLTFLELTNSSKLNQLEISNSPSLATLTVVNCTSLTSLDISTFTNLEVFKANGSGIKNLSGSTTRLDFSTNKKLKELQLNRLTSFSEIDLTENTMLEIFVYSSMPMTSIDLSNCVALQNFQIDGSAVTSLDFSNCPEIFRIINQNSSALKSVNVSGCTKLMDIRLKSSNNVTTFNISGAGSEVEEGAYKEGLYLVFAVSSGSTTQTTLQNATGWDATKMSIDN